MHTTNGAKRREVFKMTVQLTATIVIIYNIDTFAHVEFFWER